MKFRMRYTFDRRGLRARVGGAVKKEAVEITQRLVDDMIAHSPVRSGNFRASWMVTEGVPVYFRETAGTVASPLGPPKIQVVAFSDFPAFYITNGQPYAKRLEDGWSNQAPHGMVKIAVANLRGRKNLR